LKLESTSDVANTDSISFVIDMLGKWIKAEHEVDYDYSYPNSTTLVVELLSNGDYKINY
jgi:hypothetical protein